MFSFAVRSQSKLLLSRALVVSRTTRFASRSAYRGFASAVSNPDVTLESNLKSEANRLEKTLQKFWEKISVQEENDIVLVKLDDKCLRTPLGNNLVLPKSKRLLAELIALEWKNLPNLSIKPHQLPLTSIAARAVDLEYAHSVSDDGKAKVGSRDQINELLLRYLDTDTLLIFSPNDEFEGALRKEQDKLYKPIMSQVENFLTKFHPAKEQVQLSFLDSEIHGIRSNKQSESTKKAALQFLNSLNVWEYVAFEKAVLSSKSFICGIYTIKLLASQEKEMALQLDDIIRATNLETIFQTERWGEVEDTHDVEKEDIRRNLTSAVLLAYN